MQATQMFYMGSGVNDSANIMSEIAWMTSLPRVRFKYNIKANRSTFNRLPCKPGCICGALQYDCMMTRTLIHKQYACHTGDSRRLPPVIGH